jgi:ribbon-helix-helix CopG family protein
MSDGTVYVPAGDPAGTGRWSTVLDPAVAYLQARPGVPVHYSLIASELRITHRRRVVAALGYAALHRPALGVRRTGAGVYAWFADPPPPPGPRTRGVLVRLTATEDAQLDAAARQLGLSRPEVLRAAFTAAWAR